jgi:3-hydroxy-9,10-secoandrosta-1,3,5(10)-triene-9,17-dione monooxygenase reductase component
VTGKVGAVHSLDVTQFKHVVGHFATGVVVVASATPRGPVGFTCQTFGSLSLEPLLVSFAASNTGRSWPLVHQADFIGVSILAEDQEALARLFATSGADKFTGLDLERAPEGSPLVPGALAHLEGRIETVVAHGDHDLVTASVHYATAHAGKPLLYYRGGFGLLA